MNHLETSLKIHSTLRFFMVETQTSSCWHQT